MPISLGIAFSCLLSGVGAVWCMDRLEMMSAEYEDYGTARNAIERGWLPTWLPRSATNIREAHDIDTNETFAVFEFDREEVFYSSCESTAKGSLDLPRTGRGFPDFVDDALSVIEENRNLAFYRCPGRHSTRDLAIDMAAGTAYTWIR